MFIEESREQLTDTTFIYTGMFIAIKDVEEYKAKLHMEYVDEQWEITDIVIKVEKKNEYQTIFPLFSIVVINEIMKYINLPTLKTSFK